MPVSRLDSYWRKLIITKFFTKGWGKPENLKRLFVWRKLMSNRETCQAMVPSNYPVYIDKEYKDGDCRILEGHFLSPFVHQLPGIMPKEVEKASFQMILPQKWKHPNLRPVCIHLGATGDHYFWRRRVFTARPLLKETGIASIMLENPFYGSRKPKEQLRSGLLNVSDLFVMGGAIVLECLALLNWCEREGWGPLGLSGVSMGGHMASLAATNCSKPISLIPCLSWSTSSQVWTEGILSDSIPWQTLQDQFFEDTSYQDEIKKLIVSPEQIKGSYSMGQIFAKEFSKSNGINPNLDEFDPRQILPPLESKDYLAVAKTISFTEKSSDLEGGGNSQRQSEVSVLKRELTPDQKHSSELDKSKSSENRKSIVQKPHQPLTVSYAKTKTQQSKVTHKVTPKPNLSLKHGMDKSKITRSQTLTNLGGVREEALEFMRGVMDECTHLGNFSMPLDPELIIIVAAKQDAYIPREGVLRLDELWPGSELRYVDDGHVGAVLWHQKVFRQAILDSFNKQIRSHFPGMPEINSSSRARRL